jgi:hypothetical protein
MPRETTPSFVVELPLVTSLGDEKKLNNKLKAGCSLYNGCLGEALKRLKRMRENKAWKAARLIKDKKTRSKRIGELCQVFGFTSVSMQKFAEEMRDASFIGHHLKSHDTQTVSKRAFDAVFQSAFGKLKSGMKRRPKVRFKSLRQFKSIDGKADTVLLFRMSDDGAFFKWGDVKVPVMLDLKDEWQREALDESRYRTKYTRCVKRTIKGQERWFIQVVKEGLVPQRKNWTYGQGTVALDIGPSTVAVVSENLATWRGFCAELDFFEKRVRVLQRKMDRSRRATNPQCYNENGTFKKGSKVLVVSKSYDATRQERAEIMRRLAAARKSAHGALCNLVLSLGHIIKMEKLSYKAFQKMFGKSVGRRAPGMFVSMLRRKAASAGAEVVEFSTYKTRLSQYDHKADAYIKKPLSQRWHVFADGDKVQRDLYSAWLALFVTKTSSGEDILDSSQCAKHWGAMEPLLREAGSRFNQSVSVTNGLSGTVVTTSKGLCPLARQNASSLEVRQPSVSAALL